MGLRCLVSSACGLRATQRWGRRGIAVVMVLAAWAYGTFVVYAFMDGTLVAAVYAAAFNAPLWATLGAAYAQLGGATQRGAVRSPDAGERGG